jgi:pyruvate formate lyase activating enzyme
MRIAGFQKLTLVDYPGLVAATVFTQGCNFRCGYCHNPELVLPQFFEEPLITELVFNYLGGRRGKIDGVVITGGEPTLQKGLSDFIVRIKEMGFSVKLDTNGSHPEVLWTLFESNLLDYIAMDIKTSLPQYARATCIACDTVKVQESINLIINSGIPYQFRTTLVKEFCTDEDLGYIQPLIEKADHYVLQPFVPSKKIIDEKFNRDNQYTSAEVEALKSKYDRCTTRGNQ